MKDIEFLHHHKDQKNNLSQQKSEKPIIYVLDDEDFLRNCLIKFIKKIFIDHTVLGYRVPSELTQHLLADPHDFILITDMSFGPSEIDGIALIDYLKKIPEIKFEVIMMTGFGSIETAINATKKGVFKYITKPFSLEDMKSIVSKCVELFCEEKSFSLEIRPFNDSTQYKNKKIVKLDDLPELDNLKALGEMIGNTPAMHKLYDSLKKVAESNSTVLILGESGTGKELVARCIHEMSSRKSAPLVNINCGAIPSEILESELFGHMKGAFTGAVNNRIGKFEASNKGSILLDEIGDMPLLLQVKLLRVLQTKTIEPVGSNTPRKIDTRLIAATHKNICDLVKEGKFREDLYYRLNVIPVKVPALRDRKGDIPLLIKFFIKKYISGNKANLISFTNESFEKLCHYDWPGNVRELENLMERLIILKGGNIIEICDLPKQIANAFDKSEQKETIDLPDEGLNLKNHLLEIESNLIKQALQKTDGNKNQASKLLGLNRTTLIEKIKKIDVT